MKPPHVQTRISRTVSVRHIATLFLGLTAFILVSLSLSSSKLSVIVDMSTKIRGNDVAAQNNFLKSFPAEENERAQKEQSVRFEITDDRKKSFFTNTSEDNKSAESYPYGVFLNKTNERYGKNVTKNAQIDKYGYNVYNAVNKRQSTCDSCFQHNFHYVIQNEGICKFIQPGESIDLLILIFTTHTNIRARSALRGTWLSYTRNNTGNVRYVFLLGETRNQNNSTKVLERENQVFHDIIKEDFVDTYRNLTYKTIMGFKWAATKCSHAHYVMKTDDDMFVNVPYLLKILKGPDMEYMQSSIIGACRSKAKPGRNKNKKCFVSVYSYPNSSLPRYCSGTGYVTSMHVATSVYKISPSVPFFHLEDVYVGLCIKKLGFKLKAMPGFTRNTDRPKIGPCQYKGEKLIAAHRMTPTMLEFIWNKRCMRR